MRVLLSTIGSRGEVQPILALAHELRALGHEATLCVPPDFKPWVESFGFPCVPVGPEVKPFAGAQAAARPAKPSAAQRRQLAALAVRWQFTALREAVAGCDLIVGAGALQLAAPSIATMHSLPYVWASYCPATLPSPAHPPIKPGVHHPAWLPAVVNRLLWMRDAASWSSLFGPTLNEERAQAGLAPIRSVQSYVFTDAPWLAADPLLGPAPTRTRMRILQTGAWLLPDTTALPEELERFLAAGEPPIYFGFGSMRARGETARARMLLAAARALGRRAVVARGWAPLGDLDPGPDGIVVGEINHAKLFPRVAAVVHHGGAGTTTAAAQAARPQVVVPHMYDQFYWASRVRRLGVGASCRTGGGLTTDTMVAALRASLRPATVARAREVASRMERRGARLAAERLVAGVEP